MNVEITYKVIPRLAREKGKAPSSTSFEVIVPDIVADSNNDFDDFQNVSDFPDRKMICSLGEGFFEGCYSIQDIRMAFETLAELNLQSKKIEAYAFVTNIIYLK